MKNKKLIHGPYNKFKGWIRSNEMTYADIAEILGLNESTVALKVNGQSDFFLSEIRILVDTFKLNYDIFFAEDVA